MYNCAEIHVECAKVQTDTRLHTCMHPQSEQKYIRFYCIAVSALVTPTFLHIFTLNSKDRMFQSYSQHVLHKQTNL